MKVYTGSYKYCSGENCFSISGDGGKQVGFEGKRIKELSPKLSWWKEWHDNIGKIPEDENLRFYVERYYHTVLKPLGADSILMSLQEGDIMLCYEEPEDFCHRDIVAAYLELYYAMDVREVKQDSKGKPTVQKRNKYFKLIKDMLEEMIKMEEDLHGYNSIAASRAYEFACYLEKEPELCEKFPVSPETYMRLAEVFETSYNEEHNKKKI